MHAETLSFHRRAALVDCTTKSMSADVARWCAHAAELLQGLALIGYVWCARAADLRSKAPCLGAKPSSWSVSRGCDGAPCMGLHSLHQLLCPRLRVQDAALGTGTPPVGSCCSSCREPPGQLTSFNLCWLVPGCLSLGYGWAAAARAEHACHHPGPHTPRLLLQDQDHLASNTNAVQRVNPMKAHMCVHRQVEFPCVCTGSNEKRATGAGSQEDAGRSTVRPFWESVAAPAQPPPGPVAQPARPDRPSTDLELVVSCCSLQLQLSGPGSQQSWLPGCLGCGCRV